MKKTIRNYRFHAVLLAALSLAACKTVPPTQRTGQEGEAGAPQATAPAPEAKQAARKAAPERSRSSNAKKLNFTDAGGCSGQLKYSYGDLERSPRFRFTHNCPGGQANGDGFIVQMTQDGFPTMISPYTFASGRETNRDHTAWREEYLIDGSPDQGGTNQKILRTLNTSSAMKPGAVGDVLLRTLANASAESSGRAKQSLAWLADNADAPLLAQLKPYLPTGSATAQRIEQRSVANKATCNTEALEAYSNDYLRIVNYKVKNGQAYDSLAQALEIRLSKEAQRDQMQSDLRLAEMKSGVAKVRAWLRGAKQAAGTPPTLECSFVTVWSDKYSGFATSSMNTYGYNKLSLGVSRDVLGNQGVVPVVVAPPTHLWAQQVREKTGLQPEARDFAVEDSFKYPSYCQNGCRETTQHRIAFSPITPEQARAIREIAMAAKGQHLGVKTMGPPDTAIKFQIVEQVTFFNPDNPAQQLTLKGVSGKVD
ncbi:hypothetical protein GBK02_06900 [Dechloromonas sp. TW-R-39-2]|uniref:hypothetical protein n=1 Tax=Dechloromonas sp. TW-R-39-2 TaxID=2654218 RepID=UPI00193D7B74|nr:hypothetical protein [Dechloromonas sp. TW-R-39-2]QRM19138.1 hypothetical protein GBK02_06900 [Dechloromonas sp. TW-R-39-2]